MREGEEHFLIPKGRTWGRNDKSALAIPAEKPLRDRRYLDSAAGKPCEIDPTHDRATVVKAHISIYGTAAKSRKAPDDLTLDLCHDCHKSFDGLGTDAKAQWLIERILFPILRRRYWAWKARNV